MAKYRSLPRPWPCFMGEDMLKDAANSLLSTPSKDMWERIATQKRAGVVAPLFSLYSKRSLGIGDLNDLKLLIDWCSKTGNSILQLLPMNEVGSTFCPYDAISSFALEPAYISFDIMPSARKDFIKTRIGEIKKMFSRGKSHVYYEIKEEKNRILWDIYLEEGGRDSRDFRKFVEENDYWIEDFALFKVLKGHNGGRPWYEWEAKYKDRDDKALDAFKKAHQEELEFHKWVQWLAFNQFREAKAYAVSKKVFIKGDLPILISRDSADVWAHPEFFKLGFAAGAPPDLYCAKGQRWGMPTYEWDAIASDDYRYLKEKLKFAENFYDILRVDHVVGLFRIWSIPHDEPFENIGLNGSFDPPDEGEWGDHGRQILSVMLESTNMLLCGEDLGMIPQVCPDTLKEFGIPGNDVQRWVKDWNVKHDFFEPEDYRLLSVAMLSTHDTTNWPAWWENEAGTIDEALFIRKMAEKGINYKRVKNKLFSTTLSKHGRLRWLESVNSSDRLAAILGKQNDEIMDLIDMYENTYHEKEKLWKHLKMKGPMREKSDPEIVAATLKITLRSQSIFCIELLMDYLFLAGIFKGDPYQYRINRPGTVSEDNWSLVMPIALEDLLANKVCGDIKAMISASGRV